MQADAAVNRMLIAACDRTGQERGIDWVGGSVDRRCGRVAARRRRPERGPSTIIAECRLADALDKAISPNNNVHADRRPELYGRLTQTSDPKTVI